MHDMQPLTTDPNDYCFFDTETRALPDLADPRWGDVTLSGAMRYRTSCKVIIMTYCFGEDGPVKRWVLNDFDDVLKWRNAPADLLAHRERVLKGEAWFVAWNSFFDRHVSTHGIFRDNLRREYMPIRGVLDAMVQAAASNLPGKLEGASHAVGRGGKIDQGKALIALFSPVNGATPQSEPEKWEKFIEYAEVDTDELRHVFLATRPLWRWEWEQFWTSETINDRGLPMDRHFAERAAALADVYATQVNERVAEHTRGACWSVNQHVALANWVADEVAHHPEAADMLVKKYEEDEEGDGLVAASVSLARERVEKLIAFFERLDEERGLTDDEYDVLQLLETRLYGAGATFKKFAKLLPMLDDRDRLCGQYTFNGAQQTGRYSSRGVQVHNLTRAYLEDEIAAIEFINYLELNT